MRKFVLSLFIATFSVFASAQDQNQHKTDSIASISAANQTIDLMVDQKSQRFTDSLTQRALQLQIENTKEIGRRRALEVQLRERQIQDSIKYEKMKLQIAMNRSNTIGYPVVLGEDTIRLIYTNLGTFTAADRAELTSEKLLEVAAIFIPSIDTLSVYPNEQVWEVAFRNRVITTVTIADSMWVAGNQSTMAHDYSKKMTQAIVQYKEMTSVMTILKQIGLSLLVVVLCYLSIRVINRAFRGRVNRFLLGKMGTWFVGWKIREYEFMDSKRQVRFVLFSIQIVRWTLIIFLLYIVLPILFSIFPITQRLASTLFSWIVDPAKSIFWAIVKYLPNLFVILIIWITLKYAIRGLKFLMSEVENGRLRIPGFYADWSQTTFNILRLLLCAFGFVMIFPYLPGSDSDIFKGVSVFLGLIVSLGSSSAIANLVAGIVITYMRPFKIGEHIKIGDITGDVFEKTPFVTRIKTHKLEIVTIPNSNILSSTVVNYSTMTADSGVIFHTTITIGYDAPWRLVHQMMIQAALRSDYILKDPAPFVLQTSLDDFYVSYQLCAYTRNPEKQATIYSELHYNIQDVFNENGVEIASPHYRAQRDGNQTTMPEKYRPKGYQQPTFEITTKTENR